MDGGDAIKSSANRSQAKEYGGLRETKRVLPGYCAMRAATAPNIASDSLNFWVTTRLPVNTP